MAKDDVTGVAYHEDERLVRLMLDDGKGGEVPGDVVAWKATDQHGGGYWTEPKPEDEITPEDRLLYRRGPVPGAKLAKQPPQVPVELSAEIVLKGIAQKASAYVTVHGSPRTAIAYLEDRVATGMIPAKDAVAIADELGLKINVETEG